jgi:hypothetical protein
MAVMGPVPASHAIDRDSAYTHTLTPDTASADFPSPAV